MLKLRISPLLMLAALASSVAVGCDSTNSAADKKDVAKADAKGDAKSDAKADAKGDAKADAKAEAKVAEAKADAKAEAKVDEAKAEPVAAEGGAAEGGAAEGGEPLPPPEPGEAGPTYFAVNDRGVVKLDGGKFTLVEGAPDILMRDMHVGEDGKLYILGMKGVMRIEGDKATMVAETSFKTTGSVEAVAVTKDGTIWAVGFNGISKWDGKAWSKEEKSVLGSDVTLLKGIAIDGNARVWVASSTKLHTREADKWVDVDTSKAFKNKPFFDVLRRAPDGTAYALASSGLVKAKSPTEVEAVELGIDGFASLGNLAFSSNGIMAMRSKVDSVIVRNPDGTSREYSAGKDFQGDTIRAVGVDTQGRAWVGTDIGVAILGPGDQKVAWNSGSVLELAGQIEHIVPIGAGPELPTVGEPKKAALKGKVVRDGKGLADSDIELCPSPDMMFKTSPCDDSSVKFSGKTTPEGEFTFDGVPIGAYGIAVKVDGKWQLTMVSNFGTKMKEGESFDIGSINLNSK